MQEHKNSEALKWLFSAFNIQRFLTSTKLSNLIQRKHKGTLPEPRSTQGGATVKQNVHHHSHIYEDLTVQLSEWSIERYHSAVLHKTFAQKSHIKFETSASLAQTDT